MIKPINPREALTLSGGFAILEPLKQEHARELIEAVRDGELWKLWFTHVPSPESMEEEIRFRLERQAQGLIMPFVVRCANTGRLVGMTSYWQVDIANRRVEIGATWYAQSVQRSAINTEAKLMLLTQAFETWGCIAVEFRTHFMNHRSRRAIERLGAKLDGILRSHQVLEDGSLRDTVVYSIIAAEWPAVRNHLQFQLERAR